MNDATSQTSLDPVPSRERVRRRLGRGTDAPPPWRDVLPAFVVSRVFSGAIVVAMTTIEGHRLVSQGFAQWDGRWYTAIARSGYPSLVAHHGQSSWAFFPLYPSIIHAAARLGVEPWVAGVLTSHLAFLIGLIGLYRLVVGRYSPAAARLAVWLIALFPAAFVFSIVYPSSLFFAASVWAFVVLDEQRFVSAGVLAALATLSRPNGIVLAIALAATDGLSLSRRLKVLGPGLIAFLAWMTFNYAHTGEALKFVLAKRAWHEITLLNLTGRGVDTALIHLTIALMALAIVVVAVRRIPRSWTLLTILYLVPSLALGITGLARYANECFPPYAAGGELLNRQTRTTRTIVFAALGISQLLFAYWIIALRHLP